MILYTLQRKIGMAAVMSGLDPIMSRYDRRKLRSCLSILSDIIRQFTCYDAFTNDEPHWYAVGWLKHINHEW